MRLGLSEITTTRMGLGLAALGRPGYINLGHAKDLNKTYDLKAMEKHCHHVLDNAWTQGIRYFDVARSYGKAEAFLSSWLKTRSIDPSDVTVGSKWGYTYTAGWKTNAKVHEVKEHSEYILQKQWLESHNLLGSWLKLYQIHSATLESGVLENSGVLQTLARIKSENIAIGLSLSGTQQADTLSKALSVTIDGIRLFDAVQATWNLLETSAAMALKDAHDQGLGIIIKEGVANGRLTGRNDEEDFKEHKQLLTRIAVKYNTTIDALALAAVLEQPWVHIVLSGAATTSQLQSNLSALDLAKLPPVNIAEQPESYWSKRSSLSWN